ncbi:MULTISPECIES: tryptophan--tRNA ligase [Cobetia]|uniref:tryptophan--tRNA ligase n=1 Tax=Cobetia crustatorum TaxID=553385 RepID=A0A558HGH1_9GAMM|nr:MULTISPECIES: tryptophan--tRNA ligase [Cobetia]TVU68168.1 tryptophan--tRNA ligase [Cobetia crustatorum]
MSATDTSARLVSGLRPTGHLQLGHYQAVIRRWTELQYHHDAYFLVADWNALAVSGHTPHEIEQYSWAMVIDCLACGVNPKLATLFIQSWVPELTDIHMILGSVTPKAWLERLPSYREMVAGLGEQQGASFAMLGAPLMQAADILALRGEVVPAGPEQRAHVEFTREVARRFNHRYGRDAGFEEQAERAIARLGKKSGRLYRDWLTAYQEEGDLDAFERARGLLAEQDKLNRHQQERLLGYLEGGGRRILGEPEHWQSETPSLLGMELKASGGGRDEAIFLRSNRREIEACIRDMPTDPARVRRSDPGDPERCPLWSLHQSFTPDADLQWASSGCREASIGCLECKGCLIEHIDTTLAPIRERAEELEGNHGKVRTLMTEGAERARDTVRDTLDELRRVIGLTYR